jgi:hypothetical protein
MIHPAEAIYVVTLRMHPIARFANLVVMECLDCERLNEEEVDAGTDLVAADQDWPRETFGPVYEAWRRRKEAAEARLKAA